MKLSSLPFALIVTAAVSSCGATKITSSWKAENATTKPYHNIMVWGLLTEKDSSTRRLMETHLVNDLVSKGYHAISSTDIYKEKAYKKLSSAEILEEFTNTGIDAVVTIVLLDKANEDKYYPGGFHNEPVNNYGNLDKYYSTVYEKVFTPGYYISTTTYFWETNLFELPGAAITYSARTQSFDPNNTNELAHENGQLIIKDMVKKKLILSPVPKD
jgi:hypothetical protein